MLFWQAPRIATRDCKHCWLWQYNEQTGLVETFGGKPLRRRGKVKCLYATCEKGHIDEPKAWLPCNAQAFSHWSECRAVGQFPDDAGVRTRAALFEHIDRVLRDGRETKVLEMLTTAGRR